MTEAAIVGLGPWGLSVLERMVHSARSSDRAGSPTTVHIIEPGTPGSGIYAGDQPDYLLLNTPCGLHSMYPFPEQVDTSRSGSGFFEWATARGYRWVGDQCE